MVITVQGQPKEIKITSIILETDPLDPERMTMFFCTKCREGLFQYAGDVVMIVPGAVRTRLPLIRQCRICKTKYLIASSM